MMHGTTSLKNRMIWFSFENKVRIIGIDINYDVHLLRIYCVPIQ